MTKTNTLRRLATLPIMALCLTSAACSDSSNMTAPTVPADYAAFGRTVNPNASRIVSRTLVADTVVTVFLVGTGSSNFDLGNNDMVTFPLGVASICDPLTSGYGPSLWQAPCAAATTPITITAKTWMTAAGYSSAEFEPALRFVPNSQLPKLSLKNTTNGKTIKFCTPTGCIDEALTDPVLTQNLLPIAGHIWRYVRHFSGYTVTAD